MIKKLFVAALVVLISFNCFSQRKLTPELLWSIGRVSADELSVDGKSITYTVSTPDILANKSGRKKYSIALTGGNATLIDAEEKKIEGLPDNADNIKVSSDGKYALFTKDVKLEKVTGSDYYDDLPKSNAMIYNTLNYRHWDAYEDGNYSHVFVAPIINGKATEATDIMQNMLYDCPQKPHGGAEDVIFSPSNKAVVYVTKAATGTAYAISTNTDIFWYDIETKSTKNITDGMMGYDMAPTFSADGNCLAWLNMQRNGYEADKNDIIVWDLKNNIKTNITGNWDESVSSFKWAGENKIYFTAYKHGTEQLFQCSFLIPLPNIRIKAPEIKQMTDGIFDINGIAAITADKIIVSRTDMNHTAELYLVDIQSCKMNQLTHVNDDFYKTIDMCKVERKWFTATDGKKLMTWVIYPPNFDASKKYPTLLYCQGGPQSALSQFYSFRWNFQLMASNGYIVVAPNRRGMPGHGTKWNEQISADWGGQSIQDYLTAIDSVSKEPYVDANRRGAIGASYGGYSVYMLAGVHNNRFKSFIAHDGVFNTKSWYGTTEEMWFANWDMNGAYWEDKAMLSYTKFNPIEHVKKWNTPILIYQGGKDYRTPEGQSQEAFNAAQLLGIKSRMVYLPEENHWVLKAQNGLVWQREFYKWLNETLR